MTTAAEGLDGPGFFEDRHIDAQMRALIPLLTRLTVLATVVTAPFVAHPWQRALVVVLDALLALTVVEVLTRTGLLDRASHNLVRGLLLMYAVQVAFASIAARHIAGFGMLQVLTIMFAAVFFTDAVSRFALPFVAAGLAYAGGRPFHLVGAGVLLLMLATYLLVAVMGVSLSSVLREALGVHMSLYSVLEATADRPDPDVLAERGAEAARRAVGWDASMVILAEGDCYRAASFAGLPQDAVDYYRSVSLHRGDGGLADLVMQTGAPQQVVDIRTVLPRDHVLLADGFRSFAGAPIRYHGERIGVLITFHRRRRSLDDRAADRLAGVAGQLGLALGNAFAHQREAAVNERLRELNRRKDEFLANVSHELRTPATTIELAARTLQRAGERLTPSERAEVRGALVSRSRELRELIESLLDLSLSESGETRLTMSPVDWVPTVDRWVSQLEDRLGRRITYSSSAEGCVSWADAAKMERVLFALVSNAVKFSLEDSPVDVHLCTDGEVRLDVVDRGMGILPGDKERIFDRFLQLDGSVTREAGGLGIGLTLVRHFVHLHGGRVEVDSQVGCGSTFTVRIPRLDEPDA